MDNWRNYLKEHQNRFTDELLDLLSIPTIFSNYKNDKSFYEVVYRLAKKLKQASISTSKVVDNEEQIGSMMVKGGLINESDICNKFLNFKNDTEAQTWLTVMGYNPKKIQKIFAIQIPLRININKAISLSVLKEKYN